MRSDAEVLNTYPSVFQTAPISSLGEQQRPAGVEDSGSWRRKQGKSGWQQYSRALKCLWDKDVSLTWSWLICEKHCPEQGQEAGNSPTPLSTAVGRLWWGRLLLDVLIKKNYLLHRERSKKTPSHTVATKQGTAAHEPSLVEEQYFSSKPHVSAWLGEAILP